MRACVPWPFVAMLVMLCAHPACSGPSEVRPLRYTWMDPLRAPGLETSEVRPLHYTWMDPVGASGLEAAVLGVFEQLARGQLPDGLDRKRFGRAARDEAQALLVDNGMPTHRWTGGPMSLESATGSAILVFQRAPRSEHPRERLAPLPEGREPYRRPRSPKHLRIGSRRGVYEM